MRVMRWGLGTIVVVGVLWSGAWFGARWWLARTVDTAMADLADKGGPAIDCAGRKIDGWPFELRLACDGGLTATFPDGGKLTSSTAYGRGALSDLHQLVFHLDGETAYAAPDGRRLDLTSSDLVAHLGFADGRIDRLAIKAADLVVSGPLPGGATGELKSGPAELLLARDAGHPADADIAATIDQLAVSAGDIAFAPLPLRLTLAATLAEAETALAGPAALPNWQAAGGKLTLHRLQAEIGGASLTMSGEGSVGPTGLVQAQGQVVGRDLNALTTAATASGKTITPELAGLVMAFLFMGTAADDGGRSIGIRVDDGVVSANGREIARLLPLF